MKNIYLILVILFSGFQVFSQVVIVDDTVYVEMGETLTIYPLENDYDTLGVEFKILDIKVGNNPDIELISFNDTSITIKVDEYFMNPESYLYYEVNEDSPFPTDWGLIRVYLDVSDDSRLNINNISTDIIPLNNQFSGYQYGESRPLYNYPNDSLTQPIYLQSLWIGGKDPQGQLHFSGDTYGLEGIDFWTGPLSNDGTIYTDTSNAKNWARTWAVSREQIENHIANYDNSNYQMPDAILNWPAHGNEYLNQDKYIAPFIDVDLDTEYHPENGDYPLIKGDYSIFFVYNDNCPHFDSGGEPLGLEIHCMAWANKKGVKGEEYDNSIYMSYKVFNRSTIDYDSTYIGVYADLSIGYPEDNFIGCNVKDGYFFGYNADDFDEDLVYSDITYAFGYKDKIPTQGVCILGGAKIDSDDIDNPSGQCDESINGIGFGDEIVDNERFGMTNFYRYRNNGFFPAPFQAPHRYKFLRGILPGDYVLGGDDEPWRFMYSGNSDSCFWGFGGVNPNPNLEYTEEASGNIPGVRKGVASMGPFTFEAGSVEFIDIALVTAPGGQEKNSKDLLQDYVRSIRTDYLKDPMGFGNEYVGIEDGISSQSQLLVYPNPINGNIIHFEIPQSSVVSYKIYNTAGQVVQEASLEAQEKQSIKVASLKSGWYILEVQADNKTYRSKLIK